MRTALALGFLTVLSVSVAAQGRTLRVPSQYNTIQQAIIAAWMFGDTVLVDPGVYRENIVFFRKAVTVKSTQGPWVTIIDGGGNGNAVSFVNSERADSVIDGFTIRNGTSAAPSYGVYCRASPTIRNCRITENGLGGGAGVYCASGSPTIIGNQILGNYGAGIVIGDSQAIPRIENNVIQSNQGRGVYFLRDAVPSTPVPLIGNRVLGNLGNGVGTDGFSPTASVLVVNCIIAWNYSYGIGYLGGSVINATIAENFGGIIAIGSMSVENSIVWNPAASNQFSGSVSVVSHSNVLGGWQGTGNMNADPAFADARSGDFHLLATSPCIDKGDNNALYLPTTDGEGDPRKSGGTTDMGADEFHPHLYHLGDPVRGNFIEIKMIGAPASPTFLAYTSNPQVLDPPLTIPGLTGSLYLRFPFALIPLAPLPANGLTNLKVPLPTSFPAPESYPMQALIGTHLSDLDVLQVR